MASPTILDILAASLRGGVRGLGFRMLGRRSDERIGGMESDLAASSRLSMDRIFMPEEAIIALASFTLVPCNKGVNQTIHKPNPEARLV